MHGIKYYTEGNFLYLPDLGIKSISQIKGLGTIKELELLDLSDNKLSACNFPKPFIRNNKLTITELYLSNNRLQEFGNITDLSRLKELDLMNNRITDTAPLKSLSRLTILNLNGNPLTELDGLLHLDELNLLFLKDTPIDLAPYLDTIEYDPQTGIIEEVQIFLDLYNYRTNML